MACSITVKEVPVVNKYKPAAGEYDPLTNTITVLTWDENGV
ncbi:hypothetical protein [Baileyella intestinalis]